MAAVLIVDDDEAFAASLAQLAREGGFVAHVANTLEGARHVALRERIDLFALDLDLGTENGLDLLDELDLAHHGRVVVITGKPTTESAMRAVASPVVEYLVKPIRASCWIRLLRETKALEAIAAPDCSLVGNCAAMERVVAMLRKLAPLDISVLLTGETGTGKELAARMLHALSGRAGPFVSINCGAVPHELLASELFGHERGSFTGAQARHAGVFERAAHGTLFLDEITEMPAALQVYLLRALETGTVTRVGGTETIETPTRIVAATNRDPLDAIAEGKLREDLYYRIADAVIQMPALRERGDDIELLAETFVQRLNQRYGCNKHLARACGAGLRRHPWPGNVRELRSTVQRAYLMGSGDAVHVVPAQARADALQENGNSVLFRVGTTLADMERRMLLKTLECCGNDKTATAQMLGVSVRTVHNQLMRMNASQPHGTCDPA